MLVVIDAVLCQSSWFDVAVEYHNLRSVVSTLLRSIQTRWASTNDGDDIL